jgi:hypothetical protein
MKFAEDAPPSLPNRIFGTHRRDPEGKEKGTVRRSRFTLVLASALAIDPYGWSEQVCEHVANAAEPIHQSIVIKKRKVDARLNVIHVSQGDTVELEFASDEAAELHLHGYDKFVSVEPGELAVLRIEATIAGRFPLEAHAFGKAGGRKHAHLVILYLEVYPR